MIFLDTHVLLWVDQRVSGMGAKARSVADDALSEGELWVSATSFCEIAALVRRGRLALDEDVADWRRAVLGLGVAEHAIRGDVAIRAAELDGLHRDSGDRLIVAGALELDATLVTADERILGWPGPLRRLDARA